MSRVHVYLCMVQLKEDCFSSVCRKLTRGTLLQFQVCKAVFSPGEVISPYPRRALVMIFTLHYGTGRVVTEEALCTEWHWYYQHCSLFNFLIVLVHGGHQGVVKYHTTYSVVQSCIIFSSLATPVTLYSYCGVYMTLKYNVQSCTVLPRLSEHLSVL